LAQSDIRRNAEVSIAKRDCPRSRQTGARRGRGWRVRKDGTKFLASVVIDALYEGGELVGYANARHHRAGQGCRPLKESERRFRLLVNGVTG
jgi:hypothetical protein